MLQYFSMIEFRINCITRIGIAVILSGMLAVISISCSQTGEEAGDPDEIASGLKAGQEETLAVNEIFYDLMTPADAQKIIGDLYIVFDPEIINPVENQYKYISSQKIAVNLGIFGADLSYCHLFGQTQEIINYLAAIYRMGEQLGIGGEIIQQAEAAAESSVNNPDSLFIIASRLYRETDIRLRENNRNGAAALIIAGGWIEGLYIASRFHNSEQPDRKLEQQILSQKYSLDRLISLLSSNQDEELVARYSFMLRQLKQHYDSVEILFDQDDLVIDTSLRTISSSSPVYDYSDDTFERIINKIIAIRTDMVE